MLRLILLSLALCLPHPSLAKDKSPHRALKAPEQAQPWHAVGRLDLGNGFCTGALISQKLVLTAAHCLYDKRNQRLRDPEEITFMAGYRHGRAIATRKAKRVRAYENYDHVARNTVKVMANDVAVIELESPIQHPTVIPFERMRKPAPHTRVVVVSYAKGRSEIPAMEDGCKILGDRGEVLQYSCDIDSGSSGSPVFVMTTAGPKIASVMSSSGTRDGEKVSFGVTLGPRLDRIVNQLTTTNVNARFVKARSGTITNQLGGTRLRTSRLPQITR